MGILTGVCVGLQLQYVAGLTVGWRGPERPGRTVPWVLHDTICKHLIGLLVGSIRAHCTYINFELGQRSIKEHSTSSTTALFTETSTQLSTLLNSQTSSIQYQPWSELRLPVVQGVSTPRHNVWSFMTHCVYQAGTLVFFKHLTFIQFLRARPSYH